ncbi:hypothetical protein MBM_05699 [Drepanopeziza brunnea f. sp. 'multigermtubi' MB_m1]|uniref:Uncharacterized protein n=1 Tax=Marssonina brunnea f. sp. multigermtubi (strain MB_m1) TaxID=1072389 RepID=K1WFX4_MARBU|nr:uncharacterized protein MBM_05699 [Drepanopeziza brunnea f. sp. 'multigermtubi' MB_m1]EKD16405.1 hypothetical protein MBM_05699 [Drepanopeziza brunnea f. sp. 'multigermtubi' MB_m1]
MPSIVQVAEPDDSVVPSKEQIQKVLKKSHDRWQQYVKQATDKPSILLDCLELVFSVPLVELRAGSVRYTDILAPVVDDAPTKQATSRDVVVDTGDADPAAAQRACLPGRISYQEIEGVFTYPWLVWDHGDNSDSSSSADSVGVKETTNDNLSIGLLLEEPDDIQGNRVDPIEQTSAG